LEENGTTIKFEVRLLQRFVQLRNLPLSARKAPSARLLSRPAPAHNFVPLPLSSTETFRGADYV